MAVKSKNPKIAVRNPDLRQYVSGQIMAPQMTDSGAGIAAGRLCEYTSGSVKLSTEQNSAVFGVTRNAIGAGAKGDVEFGFVPVMAGSPVEAGFKIASRALGYVGKYQVGQESILTPVTGDAFTNQPANDGVEVLSSSAADVTQTVTIYGAITGALTTPVSQTLTLTGVTAVATTLSTWAYVSGVRLSGVCVGTITIREKSGGLAIKTIAPAALTAGIHATDTQQAFGLIPRRDGSDAATGHITLNGTGLDGSATLAAVIMDGTTEADAGTTPFATVTEIMLGNVVATCDVSILTNEAADTACSCGIALQTTTASGVPIDAHIIPYWSR